MTSRITYADLRGIGDRLWELRAPVAFLDRFGRLFVFPIWMRTDLYSSPRLAWFIRPPSSGKGDAAAVIHDGCVRCRYLLGISLIECHGIFLDAMREVGIGRVRRNLKYASVFLVNWTVAGRGMGLTGQAKIDQPVGEKLQRLDVWVREHYAPDGKGYAHPDGAEYFPAARNKTGEGTCGEIVELESAD